MNTTDERSIVSLSEQLGTLSTEDRQLFTTLFSVVRSEGRLVIPPDLLPWVEKTFGSAEAVEHQTIVKVLNLWTLEGALFNGLRSRRPLHNRMEQNPTALEGDGKDDFCNPETRTPTDTFGRIQGEHSVSSANVAKYDGLHDVVIFDTHNPLTWNEAQVADHFETAWRWLQAAHDAQPAAIYPFIMWNCLPRSGASIIHGHMQVALGEGMAYARVEGWRRAALAYQAQTGREYFGDLYAAHQLLGLADEHGSVHRLAHLTPVREKEALLIAPKPGPDLYAEIYRLLHLYVQDLGVRAFNMAVYLPPLGPTPEDWTGFPVIVRLIDRGDPGSATNDVGAMELFAQPVVAFDPWNLAGLLRGG